MSLVGGIDPGGEEAGYGLDAIRLCPIRDSLAENARGQKEIILGWKDGCSLKIRWNKPKDHLWFPSCIFLFCQGFNGCIHLFELLLCLINCAREKWNEYPGEFFVLG